MIGNEGINQESPLTTWTASTTDYLAEFHRRYFESGELSSLLPEVLNTVYTHLATQPDTKETIQRVMDDTRSLIQNPVDDVDSFATEVTKKLRPLHTHLRTLEHQSPDQYHAMLRECFFIATKADKLNDIFGYSEQENTVYLHLAPAKNITPLAVLGNFRNAISELRKVVAEKSYIQEVRARSWILDSDQVAKVFGRFGFTVRDTTAEESGIALLFDNITSFPSPKIAIATRESFLQNAADFNRVEKS